MNELETKVEGTNPTIVRKVCNYLGSYLGARELALMGLGNKKDVQDEFADNYGKKQ